jgi:murein L,D-transpeptidase YcbB/YkuD
MRGLSRMAEVTASALRQIKVADLAREPGTAALRGRLQLLGDLESGASADTGEARNTAALAAALRRFQSRHGLAEDGVLGPNTLAALQIPPAHRAAQLALTGGAVLCNCDHRTRRPNAVCRGHLRP